MCSSPRELKMVESLFHLYHVSSKQSRILTYALYHEQLRFCKFIDLIKSEGLLPLKDKENQGNPASWTRK